MYQNLLPNLLQRDRVADLELAADCTCLSQRLPGHVQSVLVGVAANVLRTLRLHILRPNALFPMSWLYFAAFIKAEPRKNADTPMTKGNNKQHATGAGRRVPITINAQRIQTQRVTSIHHGS